MKKILLTVLACLALVGQGYSADKVDLFNAKEIGISLNSGYVIDTSAPFQQDYSFNLGVSASYSLTKNFVLQTTLPFYQTKGVSISEIQAGVIARLPVGHFAPYVGANYVYDWDADNKSAYIGRAGLEFRFNPKWSTFVEWQYRNNNFDWDNGSQSIVGGITLIF
jgi:opacity protein-like surface antigen